MNLRLIKWIGVLAIATSPVTLHGQAVSQEAPGSIQELFEEAYYSNDEIFFNNRSIARQIEFFFGLGFPDNEINADGSNVHQVYEAIFRQQTRSGALIRTPDLPTPYETSVLLSPVVEEPVFEDTPLTQPIPAPAPVPQVAPSPIPALW